MAPSRSAVIGLYRGLLKEGVKLKDYNMRVYVSRRTKEDFHKELSSEAAESLYEQGMTDFGVLKRHRVLQDMFYKEPSYMEELSAAAH